MDKPVGEEGDSQLGDLLEDNKAVNPEEYTAFEMLKDQLSGMMGEFLTDREAKVLKLRFGLEGTAGYFVGDCLMARAVLAYNHEKHNDKLSVGAGMRYYFDQCGVFLGAGAEYVHHSPNWNDVQIPLEVGYAFFLNRYLTVEPAIYYKMSLDDFSDKTTVGLRVGFGFYF